MAATFRVKCPNCGSVYDVPGDSVCAKCKNPIPVNIGGTLQLYRMGSPIGVANGFGIYIDGQPCGHIGNKQSLLIPLAFGTHTVHITCGMTRRCRDLNVDITPERPQAFAKTHIKAGVWSNTIFVDNAESSEMPAV